MFGLIKIGNYYINPNYIVGIYAMTYPSKRNQCVIDTVNNVGEHSSVYYVDGTIEEVVAQIFAQLEGTMRTKLRTRLAPVGRLRRRLAKYTPDFNGGGGVKRGIYG